MAIEYGDGSDSNTGRVIRVFHNYWTGSQTLSSTSFTTIGSGLAITLTPESSSSKILMIGNFPSQAYSGARPRFDIDKDGTPLGDNIGDRASITSFEGSGDNTPVSFWWLDEPGDTNSHTYTPVMKQSDGGGWYGNASSNISTFTIFEVAG
tara:strand:- start:350 stop:802 length:453 start_codon:yes stop_codon:yes gene_type:complete